MTTRVVHVKDDIPGAAYIGRAMPRQGLKAGAFQNPFRIDQQGTRAEVIAKYRRYVMDNPALLIRLPELRGRPLACWCRHDGEAKTPENACHGDEISSILERFSDDELRAMGRGEMVPSVTVAMDRPRAERLIELAAALQDLGHIDFDEWPPEWDGEIDRLNRARAAMERTDCDPLPEEGT